MTAAFESQVLYTKRLSLGHPVLIQLLKQFKHAIYYLDNLKLENKDSDTDQALAFLHFKTRNKGFYQK